MTSLRKKLTPRRLIRMMTHHPIWPKTKSKARQCADAGMMPFEAVDSHLLRDIGIGPHGRRSTCE
ncbi:hypothetical protein [Rhizobium sp. OAE497]|jgi:hypothetical protein|uniref:hypothetical protein n=1 Tax=Rhizobium sp. OAE497 TaxID=2663796 RepID=UPI0018F749D1